MEYGTIKPIEITQEMRSAYLDYAMSVIVARALPDVRDGLKPVQRRIIYVMEQLALQHTAPYKKSARIVGDTLGRYHPHGDAAVYEAMVRLAQDFTMRYPLVDGQGNFGCFTGDTKVRLLDGTDRTFAELAEMYGPDTPFYVYSIDDGGNVVVAEGRNSRATRRNAEIMELELDNGEVIRCTPDHRFMLHDGSYRQAKDLTNDDSLMPGYFTTAPVREATFNHRIVAKRVLAERADVYDITVESYHNFLLSSGVFVHNSIDGDSPAAQRYTEARLAAIAEEMLQDIEKETVDFSDNFDGTLQEPQVLPGAIPNLLLNGAAGIAVGMATNIPPHNLNELCAAIALLIDNPEASVEDLMRVLPGPDFPTGGIIMGQEGILTAYSTGKGHFVVRAKAHVEEATRGRANIIVTELPYQVNKARLLERIADLVKQDRLSDISDLRDESDRSGMRVVITLKREAQPQTVLNQLFKFTQMQVTFGVNLLALVEGNQPRVLTLKRMLQHYISHRQEVIIRRTRHDLEKARNRAHILEGLKIALDYLDEVIDTIRRSQTAETAKVNLIRRFKFSEIQAQAILDLQLRRLAALERKKIEEEYQEVLRRITELEDILAHPKKVLALIQADMLTLREKYGDTRRTRITDEEAGEITAEDLVPDEDVLVTLTERGYIKRLPLDTYRRQRRGSRGVQGVRTREQDAVGHVVICNTKDDLLFFSDRGKCYQLKVHQLPDAERDARGLPLVNLAAIDPQERVTGLIPVPNFETVEYLIMVTRGGKIKRTSLAEFRAMRPSGVIAVLLEEGDILAGVRLAQGTEDVLVVTAQGQALRFSQDDLRPMGRNAGGVKAINLAAKDTVVGLDLCHWPEAAVLTVTSDGYGKRASLAEYPVQGRGGKGVATAKAGQTLAVARVVRPEDEVTIISAKGVVVRIAAREIARKGRPTRGDNIVQLDKGDAVVAMAVVRGETSPTPTAGGERPGDEGAKTRAPRKKTEAATPAGLSPRGKRKTKPKAKAAPSRPRATAPAEPSSRPPASKEKGSPARRAESPHPALGRSRERTSAGPAATPAPTRKRPPATPAAGPRKATPAPTRKTPPATPAAAPAPTRKRPPVAPAPALTPVKKTTATATGLVRQMTLDEAIIAPAAADRKKVEEDEGPPLIIRRMGRVLSPEPAEGEDKPKPAAAPRAVAPGTDLVRRPPSPKEKGAPRGKAEPAPGRRPVPAGKKRAAQEPAVRKRTDVGITPVLGPAVPARPTRGGKKKAGVAKRPAKGTGPTTGAARKPTAPKKPVPTMPGRGRSKKRGKK